MGSMERTWRRGSMGALSLDSQPPVRSSVKNRICRSHCEIPLKRFQIPSGGISPVLPSQRPGTLTSLFLLSFCPSCAQPPVSAAGLGQLCPFPTRSPALHMQEEACKAPVGSCFLLCALRSRIPYALCSTHPEPSPQGLENRFPT